MEVTTIGLDLAKNIFQVHGITEDEEVVFSRSPYGATQCGICIYGRPNDR